MQSHTSYAGVWSWNMWFSTAKVNGFLIFFFFFDLVFFHRQTIYMTAGEGRVPLLFFATTSTCFTNIQTMILNVLSEWLPCRHLLITGYVIIRLLFDEIYPPLRISIWLNVDCSLLVDFMLVFISFLQKSGGFKLASMITLVLQTKQIKQVNHPIISNFVFFQN